METKLYAEYHDLLFSYFGVSLSASKQNKIATVRRNIKLKQKMRVDFLNESRNPHETIKKPYKKFKYSELIIRSIDDTEYPDIDLGTIGISPWFKVETYDFYHNGIEVILAVRKLVINEEGYWDIIPHEGNEMGEKNSVFTAFEIGRIPYENIIDYDLDGDEYYNFPHMYCDFKNSGMPYEEFVYSLIGNDADLYKRLDNNFRKEIESV